MAQSKKIPGHSPNWCVHFQSMAQHQTCEANVNYTALNGGSEYRRMQRLPCFIKSNDKAGQRVECEHFKAPAANEIALHNKWHEERQNLLKEAMIGIAPWRVQHQGVAHSEVVKCPVCKGHLHLAIAARDGHVRGRCETAGCVSWEE